MEIRFGKSVERHHEHLNERDRIHTNGRIRITSPKGTILFGVLLLGIVTFITLIIFLSNANIFRANGYIETEAIFVEYYEEYDYSKDEMEYISVAEYEVDGKYYTIEKSSYNYPELIGKKITIKYDPNNPQRAIIDASLSTFIFSICILAIFAICGIVIIITGIKKLKRGY